MKQYFKKLVLVKLTTLSLILSIAPINFAEASTLKKAESKVELVGGKLEYGFTENQVYDFGKIEIKTPAKNNKSYYKKVFDQEITDSRGTGDGYTLVVSATRFTDINNPGKKLNPGTLSISSPSSPEFVRKTNSDYGNGTINIGKRGVDGSSITLLTAGKGAGMGSYSLVYDKNSLTFKIIQDDAKAGKYSSTITFTLSNSPGN